jgi:tetratricopeptide (TPR) repeat protein
MPSSRSPQAEVSIAAPAGVRPSGQRRIGRLGAAGVVLLALLMAAGWIATRFDPLGRARDDYGRRRHAAALKAALGHLRWFPGDSSAALMAARCLTRLGRPVEAEAYYRRAGSLGPEDLHARAFGLVQAGDAERAAQAYEELLAKHPDDILALKRLAAVRMGRKDWRATLALADRLRAIPSGEVAGLTLSAIAHHELKHYTQAVEAARNVVELDPDLAAMPLPRPLFWNNLALDLLAIGRAEEARAFIERALVHSDDAGLMELLGLSYSHLGLVDQAERCWREAERRDPDNADVCLDLGRLAMARHRWGEAVEMLTRAATRSRDSVEPLYSLSQAYRMLGDRAEAERYRRLADERRRAQPPRGGGMGGDLETGVAPDGMRGSARLPEPSR